MSLDLVAIQHAHPRDPDRDLPRILYRAARTVEHGGIAVLPEYFYRSTRGSPESEELARLTEVEEQVRVASEGIQGALVATVPEVDAGDVYNTAVVAEHGKIVHRQRKLQPTPKEREGGVAPGQALSVATVQGVTVGVLVCADVLVLDHVARMAKLSPDVVAVPVLSPNRPEDPTRSQRTGVFVARAWDMGAYVVKAGGHAKPHVAGRSLITAPWGVLAQAPDDFEDALLQAPYEPERLASVRRPFDELRSS